MQELNIDESMEQQDIKTTPITSEQIEQMAALAGSYEALFSKRSRQYRARGLHEQTLGEEDFKRLILEEYTFLKRPVFVVGEQIFVGNSKKVVEAAKSVLVG